MMRSTLILCLAIGACSRSPTANAPTPVAASPNPPLAPSLTAGADLDGPVAPPSRSARHHAHGASGPINLGGDRPALAIEIPSPPEGGAASFTFGDDRRGWVARIPGSLQLPSVAYGDGKVFVSAGFESYSFFALDAGDGHIVWASQQLEDNGPTAPIFDDGHVLFNTESCTLFCMDARTGKKLWLKRLGDPTLSQPAVAGGLVFAAHPGDTGPELSAYRVANGDEVWTRTVGSELLAAPVVAGDSVFVSTLGGRSYRFTRGSGRQIWSRALGATTAPWIDGDRLFVARRAHDREVQSVVAIANGRVLADQFAVDAPYLSSVPASLADWKRVWSFEGSRPVVVDGVRYAAMGGELEASDSATGERLWSRRDAHAAGKRSLGSVALAGPEVVIATRDGDLFGLDVDTGYTLWAWRTGHKIVAEPVVARGWIFAATVDGRVIALQTADETVDGWHMFGGNPQHDGPIASSL